jgi:hypothetical protein
MAERFLIRQRPAVLGVKKNLPCFPANNRAGESLARSLCRRKKAGTLVAAGKKDQQQQGGACFETRPLGAPQHEVCH